jgi:hypothetical protein
MRVHFYLNKPVEEKKHAMIVITQRKGKKRKQRKTCSVSVSPLENSISKSAWKRQIDSSFFVFRFEEQHNR